MQSVYRNINQMWWSKPRQNHYLCISIFHLVIQDNSTDPELFRIFSVMHDQSVDCSWMGRTVQEHSGTVQCSSGTVQVLSSNGKWLPPGGGRRLQTIPKQSTRSRHIFTNCSSSIPINSPIIPKLFLHSPRMNISCSTARGNSMTVHKFAIFVCEQDLVSGDRTLGLTIKA